MPDLRLSLLITFISSNAATLVQIVVTLILSRLLTPAEIGVFAMTAVFVSIVEVFRDFGVGGYLQREDSLGREKVSAAFGFLLFTSWGLAALMFMASSVVADFFGQPGVADVMRVMALGFLIIPFGTITHNLLTRELMAREQAHAKAVSVVTYACTAISLSILGYSYMALAWAYVASIAATAVAYYFVKSSQPVGWPIFRNWGGLIDFGAGAVLGNCMVAVNNAIPDLFLGKLGSVHQVGIMSRALSTPNMLLQILGPTAQYAVVPLFAKKHHAKESFSPEVSLAISYYSGIIWPALLALALFADSVVFVLYGVAWVETVPLIQVLCFGSMLWIPFSFNNGLLLALGRPHFAAVPTGVAIVTKLSLAYIFFDGALLSFAHSLMVSAILLFFVNGWVLWRVVGVPIRTILQSLHKSAGVTVMVGCVLFAFREYIPLRPPIVQLACVFVLLSVTWFSAVVLFKHPLRLECKRVLALLFR